MSAGPAEFRTTDAVILAEFKKDVKHLLGQKVTRVLQQEMSLRARPFLARLLRNGHSMLQCEKLMREAVALEQA